MGETIGQIPGALAGLRGNAPAARSSRAGQESSAQRRPQLLGERGREEERFTLFRERRDRSPRVGFGENTVTVPGAAIDALGRGLDSARRLTPNLQELQAEARERFRELRAETQARIQERSEGGRRVEFDVNRAGPGTDGARDFVNRLNDSAGRTLARINSDNQPEPRFRGSFSINGQNFPIGERFGATDAPDRSDARRPAGVDFRA